MKIYRVLIKAISRDIYNFLKSLPEGAAYALKK